MLENQDYVDKLLPKGSSNMFASLARSIVGQQLAMAAAFTIYKRFLTACKVKTCQRMKHVM